MRIAPTRVAILLAVALASAAAGAGVHDGTADRLIGALNDERGARRGPILAPSPTLEAYAQRRAEAIAASGKLRSSEASADRGARLRAAGYEPYLVSEVMAEVETEAGADADVAQLLRDWRRDGSDNFDELLRAEFRDVGVGHARVPVPPRGSRAAGRERNVYVLVVGLAWPDLFAERTASLADLASVREDMLTRVNAERRSRRRPPLRLDSRLNRAAQEYADRMLREAFYAHTSPGGETVLDRCRAASYPVATVAENLALGPWSAEESVEGWMDSPGHRQNLLDMAYRDLGVGLAYGHNRNGWQVIWVQVFGLPR